MMPYAANTNREIVVCAIIACMGMATPMYSQDGVAASRDSGAENFSKFQFTDRFIPYEMMYFASEPGFLSDHRGSNAKFQISFAFRLFGLSAPGPNEDSARSDGLYLSYTQLSFWDTASSSKPFYDSSYKPELWWRQHIPLGTWCQSSEIEGGYAHESNGRGGIESRSVDRLFIRPVLGIALDNDIILNLKPRVFCYIDKSDNPDIDRYRGYADLSCSIGKEHGLQVDLLGRIGSDGRHGCLQTELTYPLDVLTGGHAAGYLYLQSFVGYSETLLDYDQRTDQPRILLGIALVR